MTSVDENWDLQKPKKNIKSKVKIEIFYLSNLLNDGACLRCMNKTCKLKNDHGNFFPEQICNYVQNPLYIQDMDKVFNNANIDFEGKKPFYTICNYINADCKNCYEGRIKYIPYKDNQNIAICYPIMQNIRNKITIGVHADIKLTLKGKKIETSIIPVEIIYENQEQQKEDEEWPNLSNNVKNEHPRMDFSKIRDNMVNELDHNKKLIKEKENNDYNFLLKRNDYLENELIRLNQKIKDFETMSIPHPTTLKNTEKYDEILFNVKELGNRVSQQFFETNYEEYMLI